MALSSWQPGRARAASSSIRTLAAAAISSISSQVVSGGNVVKHSIPRATAFAATNVTQPEADLEIVKPSVRSDSGTSDFVCRVCDHDDWNGSHWMENRFSPSRPRWLSNLWIVTGGGILFSSSPQRFNFGVNSPAESRSYSTRHFSLSQRKREGFQDKFQWEEFQKIRIRQDQRRSHTGHAHDHHRASDGRGKDSQDVLGLGLWGDVALAIGKGGAGYLSGSKALLADAAHSVSDVALSAVALWTSKVAHEPKNKQHPYGHGKYESVGALGISGVLLLTGVGIAWQALESLQPFLPMLSDWVHSTYDHHNQMQGDGHHHGIDLQHPYVALTAAVCSIGVKEMFSVAPAPPPLIYRLDVGFCRLYWRTKRIGEAENSQLLKASAWHHRSDAISSVVALLGVGGSILGLPLLDPVAGIVVSGMIVKAGFESGYQSLQDLVDSGVQESVLSPIRRTVLSVQGVKGCHHLRGRRMGSSIHVDAHIEVDPWLSVSAAHNIAEIVRHQLHHEHSEVSETFVHIEPADGGTKVLTDDEAQIENDHHGRIRDTHMHKDEPASHSNQHLFAKRDLTKKGSKSELIQESLSNENCTDDSFDSAGRQHADLDHDVRDVVGTNFRERMIINHVTSHFLHGKKVVEVEVSMSPDISVRNAMGVASDAEQAILEKIPDISAVRVQLKLSRSPGNKV